MEYLASSTLSLGTLLTNYWSLFIADHKSSSTSPLRLYAQHVISQVMKCNTKELGYATYVCKTCDYTKRVYFACHTRLCTRCSKAMCDKRVNSIRSWLPMHIQYIHITWTLPEELRDFWLAFRHHKAFNILFDQAHSIILGYFEKNFSIVPWVFSILHTFGSYINWNPHIHMIVSLGGIDYDERKTIKWKYIHFGSIVSQRRYHVVKECRALVKKHRPKRLTVRNPVFNEVYKKPSWYVQISDPVIKVHKVMWYLTRYMYRAPISIAKIIRTNLISWDIENSTITLKYINKNPREERQHTYSIKEAFQLLVRHIPDKNFRNIRFAWAFANRVRKKTIAILNASYLPPPECKPLPKRPKAYRERMITTFNKDPLSCPCCQNTLQLYSLTYYSKLWRTFETKYIDSS
jgi:hypothetical protein